MIANLLVAIFATLPALASVASWNHSTGWSKSASTYRPPWLGGENRRPDAVGASRFWISIGLWAMAMAVVTASFGPPEWEWSISQRISMAFIILCPLSFSVSIVLRAFMWPTFLVPGTFRGDAHSSSHESD